MLCDLNADVDLPDNKGNAPLHSYAIQYIPVVLILISYLGLAHGAISLLVLDSLLVMAITQIDFQVVQLLIERGCSYTARNNDGFTASDYAYS